MAQLYSTPWGGSRVLRQRCGRSPKRWALREKSVDAAVGRANGPFLERRHGAGVNEMARVARRRLVFFTWRPDVIAQFWLVRDYLPLAAAAESEVAFPLTTLNSAVPGTEVRFAPVPIPHYCADDFAAPYWRRPQAYLNPGVRAGMRALRA